MKIYNTIYRNKVPITNLACFEKVKTISLVWNHISGIAFYSESLTRKPPFFNAASFVVVSIFLDAAVLPSTVYSVHICRVCFMYTSNLIVLNIHRHCSFSFSSLHVHLVWTRILQHWNALLDPPYYPLASGFLWTVVLYFTLRWKKHETRATLIF